MYRNVFSFTADSFFSRHEINLTSQLLTSFNTTVLCIVYVKGKGKGAP